MNNIIASFDGVLPGLQMKARTTGKRGKQGISGRQVFEERRHSAKAENDAIFNFTEKTVQRRNFTENEDNEEDAG